MLNRPATAIDTSYKLYDYFRSSTAFRVRIGLNFKNVPYETVPVHLLQDDHKQPDYLDINPQGLVPALQMGKTIITQSLAILEYLEEVHPDPAFLPSDPLDRAYIRSLCLLIACDIHPINNLRVLDYLKNNLHIDESQKITWYKYWVQQGFEALEQFLSASKRTGQFCLGNTPCLADICLVPQYYNAKRFNCPLNAYPNIEAIAERCLNLPAFSKALPKNE